MSDFIYFSSDNLQSEIGQVNQDSIIPFFSEGKWSMHELLIYLLNISGPSKVWLSTFSISETAIRAFSFLIENKLILELHCLFDHTIKRHKLDLLYFASNIASTIKLCSNHSKIILIENDHWKITVVGSANMTPNVRKEAGVIFTQAHVFYQYKNYLVKALEEGTPVNFE